MTLPVRQLSINRAAKCAAFFCEHISRATCVQPLHPRWASVGCYLGSLTTDRTRAPRWLVDRFFGTAHIRGIPARRADVYSVVQGFVERGSWIVAAPRRVVGILGRGGGGVGAACPVADRQRSSSFSTITLRMCPRKPGLGSPPNRKGRRRLLLQAFSLRAAPHPCCERGHGRNPPLSEVQDIVGETDEAPLGGDLLDAAQQELAERGGEDSLGLVRQ